MKKIIKKVIFFTCIIILIVLLFKSGITVLVIYYNLRKSEVIKEFDMNEILGFKVLKKCKKRDELLRLYKESTVKSIFEIYPVKDVIRNLSLVKENQWALDADAVLEKYIRKRFNTTDSRVIMYEYGSFTEGSVIDYEGEKYLLIVSVGLRLMAGEGEYIIKL